MFALTNLEALRAAAAAAPADVVFVPENPDQHLPFPLVRRLAPGIRVLGIRIADSGLGPESNSRFNY